MKKFEHVISSPNGLHARPVSNLVKLAKQYESEVTITVGDKTGSCKKMFAIMGLGNCEGKQVSITIDGPDEDICFTRLESFFREKL